MRNKHLFILSVIFIVLAGFLLLRIYSPQIFPQRPSFFQEKISSIKKEAISSIEMTKADNKIELVKKDGVWELNKKLVDKEKISEFIDKLINYHQADLAAETSLKHKDFELTSDLATSIKFDGLLTLLIGKGNIDGVYVRFEDSNLVFLLKDLTPSDFSIDSQDWYDKTIVAIEEQNINKLVFQKKGEKIILSQKENSWFSEENNQEVVKDKLNPALLTLASFKARSIAEANQIVSYPLIPFLDLDIEYEGEKESLSFFKGEDDYLVKRGKDGENFIISKFQAEDFDISKNDLLKEN